MASINPENPSSDAVQNPDKRIEPLWIPKEFAGYVKEEDVKGLDKRDKRILIGLSVIEQWQNWVIDVVVKQHKQINYLEDFILRQKTDNETKIKAIQEKPRRLTYNIVKWIGVCMGSAIMVEVVRLIFKTMNP